MATKAISATRERQDGVRCAKCDKLIAKNLLEGHLEIKCPRCGTLNVIFEKMPEQVIITDSLGVILYINKAAEKATGYSLAEAIGKKPSDLWGGHMPKTFYEEMWKILKKSKRQYQEIFTNRRKTGELYEARFCISPIVDINKKVIFYVAIEETMKKQT